MKLVKKYEQQVKDFLLVCQWLSDAKYATSHGGNLAYKVDEDVYLITPTRRYKNILVAEDLVFIDGKGNTLEGKRKPTGEMAMYLHFFRERPDIVSAIHCHPPYMNAFAILKGVNWLERPVFPEMIVEAGPVPIVPYGEPISQQLADNFLPYLKKYNTFMMENHGLVAISPSDIIRTMHIIDLLETASISILSALAVGEIKEIPREEVEKLDRTQTTRELPRIGAPGVNPSLASLYFQD
ncbi:MAG: class II aldolase/adducin family protein [Spirochaetales bacterium]|nr:class II aldolase/adducin family protein [Spirochaetales bacterium]